MIIINELKRLTNSSWIVIFIVTIFVLMVGYSINLKLNDKPQNEYFSHNIIYDEGDDISKKIESIELDLIDLDRTERYYDQIVYNYKTEISIYQVLYENSIDYNDVAEIGGISDESHNTITLYKGLISIYLTGGVILVLLLCVTVITLDFDNGVYKFIYGRKIDRTNIIRNKIRTILMVIGLYVLGAYILSLVLVYPIENDFSFVIVFIEDFNPILCRLNSYTTLLLLSTFYTLIVYTILFVSISLFVRKTLHFLVVSSLLFIVIQYVIPSFSNVYFYALAFSPIFALDLGVNLDLIVYVNITLVFLLALLYCYSKHVFINANLVR
jgi:hypothetical protein